eukprot:Sspe_Gene.47627::Locus_24394_Transcript_1_1_Confidence_1.000_Length_1857::g.47627::m.47627
MWRGGILNGHVADSFLYDLLECECDADIDTIHRQYRKLALRCHPTKVETPESAERFRKLAVAYDVLSVLQSRKQYDQEGTFEKRDDLDPLDVFGRAFHGTQRKGRPKPKDIIYELEVTLEGFYNGKKTTLAIVRDRLCPRCGGHGMRREGLESRCVDCCGAGKRVVVQQLNTGTVHRRQAMCVLCNGAGAVVLPEDRCQHCRGERTVQERETFTVIIEPGMRAGDFFTYQAQGHQIPGVLLSGDVIIVLESRKHARFTRKGDHLVLSHDLSLVEALTGFHVVIEHLDGRQLVVQPLKGQVTSPNMLWQVDNEGMPRHNSAERGHLVLKFAVSFPERVSDEVASKLCDLLGRPHLPLIAEECIPRYLGPCDPTILEDDKARRRTATAYEAPAGAKTCTHQ